MFKDGKADMIQAYSVGMGPLQKEFTERRETGLNSEYGMDKREFIAKKQGWGLE